jgi:hypothetical protein
MALKKNVKFQVGRIVPDIQLDSDLLSRIETISEQTGLATPALFQKWVLQEESLIGLIQGNKEQTKDRTTGHPTTRLDASPQQISDVQDGEETAEASPEYRKMLIQRVQKLKKEGMTLVKIADIFNEENVRTVSGKGKWYSSSITNLLKSNA